MKMSVYASRVTDRGLRWFFCPSGVSYFTVGGIHNKDLRVL